MPRRSFLLITHGDVIPPARGHGGNVRRLPVSDRSATDASPTEAQLRRSTVAIAVGPRRRAEDESRMDLEELRACRSAVITIADAAAVLGVDARTVSRAVQCGELPVLRVGRRLLIPRLPLLARLGVIDSSSGAPQDSPTVA
ncbi:protein of unknown function [Modestobacter italicus]|uniref:Helix-turn-helix domain-containing protein n=2 Tax=Modestobacter italicus (strain DSM 44449 / CECT 9708 / BC 501) TaxID=2732864 RepID=I4EX60_MODI5|nr:protein of unknown function [Modestobacter marinus]